MLLAPILLIPGTLFNPAVGGIGAVNLVALIASHAGAREVQIGLVDRTPRCRQNRLGGRRRCPTEERP